MARHEGFRRHGRAWPREHDDAGDILHHIDDECLRWCLDTVQKLGNAYGKKLAYMFMGGPGGTAPNQLFINSSLICCCFNVYTCATNAVMEVLHANTYALVATCIHRSALRWQADTLLQGYRCSASDVRGSSTLFGTRSETHRSSLD